MKVWNTILKIVAALAAVAGVVFVIVKYGDKIVAWVKDMACRLGLCCCCDDCCECCEDCDCSEVEIIDEAPAEEVPAQEGDVQAEEKDFEG